MKTLNTGLPGLPITRIGERLKAIQTEHPTEFAAANTKVLNPPPSNRSNDPFGFAHSAEGQGLIIDPQTGVAYRPSRHGDASLTVTMTMSLPAVAPAGDAKSPAPQASP